MGRHYAQDYVSSEDELDLSDVSYDSLEDDGVTVNHEFIANDGGAREFVTSHRRRYLRDNHDALLEMYVTFIEQGRALFGDAFFQNGTFTNFGQFVYAHTCLGASNF